MMLHELWVIFGWPNGIVVGNLMASAILGIPAVMHLDKRAKRRHEVMMHNMNGTRPEGGKRERFFVRMRTRRTD